jgi:hypothetical protein
MDKKLIAPCGMNCGLCVSYLRSENKCPGCVSGRKVNDRPIKCSRKLCKERKGEYCFECDKFPCKSIKTLDKRYREKYGMSQIENLEHIRDYGIDKFIENENKKWVNNEGILCVHNKTRYKQ